MVVETIPSNEIRRNQNSLIVTTPWFILHPNNRDLVPVDWIRLFNPHELQRLIGGEGGQAIDLADLKRNTRYGGGYHESQPVMKVVR